MCSAFTLHPVGGISSWYWFLGAFPCINCAIWVKSLLKKPLHGAAVCRSDRLMTLQSVERDTFAQDRGRGLAKGKQSWKSVWWTLETSRRAAWPKLTRNWSVASSAFCSRSLHWHQPPHPPSTPTVRPPAGGEQWILSPQKIGLTAFCYCPICSQWVSLGVGGCTYLLT